MLLTQALHSANGQIEQCFFLSCMKNYVQEHPRLTANRSRCMNVIIFHIVFLFNCIVISI